MRRPPVRPTAMHPPLGVPAWARRRCRTAAFLASLLAWHCSRPAPIPVATDDETILYTNDAYRVSLELPANWVRHQQGDHVVFSGPEGTNAFYTTMTLQGLERDSDDLVGTLRAAYQPVTSESELAWEAQQPAVVANRPAISYRMRFSWHETQRMRAGVLIDTGRIFVDLAYTADETLFDESLPAFVRAVDSLSAF